MSRPGAIHRKIAELLEKHPEGLSSGQIRAKLNIAADEHAQLDRRRRDLRKWYILERRQSGKEWVYILMGKRKEPALERVVNIRVRAAVLGRAHGRCQMCGRTVAHHQVVLVVDHRIPVEWGGSNVGDSLWAMCLNCQVLRKRWTSGWAIPRGSAQDRVLALLAARRGRWVAATWLKAVAGTADWSRSIRALRTNGHDIRVRRTRPSGERTTTYYSLLLREI